jgi:alpha-tubulin suppressor-like RCC1 family protein
LFIGCGGGGSNSNANNGGNEIGYKIATGNLHSLALSNSGKVYGTGLTSVGQLGLGNANNRNTFIEITGLNDKNIKAISVGEYYSFALSGSGKVYAAGLNLNGELGLGDISNSMTFVEVTDLSSKNITAISVGFYQSFALSNSGKVYATGLNYDGQLGLDDHTNHNTFTEVTGLNDKNIIAISTNVDHSLALSGSGKVYATGDNANGELGLGDYDNRNTFTEVTSLSDKNIIAISVGFYQSFALSGSGKVYATGLNYGGQLGLGDHTNHNTFTEVIGLNDKNIIAISTGADHSLALSSEGKVYAAGDNYQGQLGLGDNTDRNTFTEVTGLNDKNIIAISTNADHSLALSGSGKVYATGDNGDGQLGLGNTADTNVFIEAIDLSN